MMVSSDLAFLKKYSLYNIRSWLWIQTVIFDNLCNKHMTYRVYIQFKVGRLSYAPSLYDEISHINEYDYFAQLDT